MSELASPAVKLSLGRATSARLSEHLRSAGSWHYATLALGFAVIILLQREQWFFFDEWAFIKLNGYGIWHEHVGHWSTAPTLIYDGLMAVFGLRTYLPYALLITVLHLAAAHLSWRIAIRAGANPWIATAATLAFIFFGSGSENIFWAFQIGYVGALVVGLLAFYLALKANVSHGRFAVIVLVGVFSLTWSGTSLPLVVATAAALWWKSGWRRAAIFAATTAAVYLTWYLLAVGPGGGAFDNGGFGLYKLFVSIPEFIGVMLVLGFGEVFPVAGLGIAILVALAIWVVRVIRRKPLTSEAFAAVLLVGAAAVFALITAYSRAVLSVGAGRSPRYIYLIVLLMLPALAVGLSQLLGARVQRIWIAAVLLVGYALGYQAVNMVNAAEDQTVLEQGTHRLMNAALQLYLTQPDAINLDAMPDPRWAPDIEMQDLIDLYNGGYFTGGGFEPSDLDQAELNVLLAP